MFTLKRALLGVLFLGALLTVSEAAGIWLYPLRAPLHCRAEVALVMGAAQYDGVPSPAFQRRLDRALELYQSGCAKRIVVTGGKRPGDRFSEGEAGVRYLMAQGVPEAALASETASTTSFENLAFSRELIRDEQVTVVTDDLHAYRTHWLAERLGYTAELAPVRAGVGRLGYGVRELVILSAYHLGVIR